MKNPILTLSVAAALSISPAIDAADLTIRVTDIRKPDGAIYLSVFDSPESYADDAALHASRSRVDGESMQITLHDLPPGQYAVRLFHDTNHNGELDRNMLGIPREGYGFSNDAGARGPASFDDAAIGVEDDEVIVVRLR